MIVYQSSRMSRYVFIIMMLVIGVISPAIVMGASDEAKSPSLSAAVIGGAAAGAVDVPVSQPFTYRKNMRQIGAPVSCNPLVVYRGSSVQLLNMVPTTVVQVLTEELLKHVFSGDDLISGIARSLVSGIISAPTAVITNSLVVYMQRNGGTPLNAFRTIYNAGGCAAMMRGVGLTAVREAFYTTGYLEFYPKLSQICVRTTGDELCGRSLAGCITGIGISLITQPLDTVATKMQDDYAGEKAKTLVRLSRIYKTEGLRGYYSGILPRTASIIIGITVMAEVAAKTKAEVRRLME